MLFLSLQDLEDSFQVTKKEQKKLQQQHKKLQEDFEEKNGSLKNKEEVSAKHVVQSQKCSGFLLAYRTTLTLTSIEEFVITGGSWKKF